VDKSIERLLGIAGDEKRIYRFLGSEVEEEEYQYCQLLDQLVFGEKGYVETLGQTWSMVSDPRFMRIESAFIVNRKAYFGGDARQGKQYMSSDGVFVSTIADLEQYSEVLGEGRHFWCCIVHPEEGCPVRKWHERIYSAGSGGRQPRPEGLSCTCKPGGLILYPNDTVPEQVTDPHGLKDASEGLLWALVRRECPNYFTQKDAPNAMAKRLFDLFRADLVGLIADYTPTPLVDAYIELDSGDVVKGAERKQDAEEEGMAPEPPPQVFLEVDLLEKALTYRATMRATAARILDSLHFDKILKGMAGSDPRLTDLERDTLLRMVYQSEWPEGRAKLMTDLLSYVAYVTREPYEERLEDQLEEASEDALDACRALQQGELEPINSYTEPTVEVQLDQHAAVMEAILRNPLKQELFLVWVEAERRGDIGNRDETDRLNMSRLYSILTPVFTDPGFDLDGEGFWGYMDQAKRLGYYSTLGVKAPVEGSFVTSEEDFRRSRALREARGEKRVPLPPEEPTSLGTLDKVDAVIKETGALKVTPKDVPPEKAGGE
jgi:hypothetical protein